MAFNEIAQRLELFTDIVEFERLASDILSRNGHRGIDPQSIGRRDGGKDAVLRYGINNERVYHYSLRKDWRVKLFEDLETVRTHGRLGPGKDFVFVTSHRVDGLEQDALREEVRTTFGWNLDIWHQERLRVELQSNSQDLAAHYLQVRFEPMTAAAMEHLAELQHGVIKPLYGSFAAVVACLKLGGPLIRAGFNNLERLVSHVPREEILYPWPLAKAEGALWQDAPKHFARELNAAAEVHSQYVTSIALPAIALADAIAAQAQQTILLPAVPEGGGPFFHAKHFGSVQINRALGCYAGAYTLREEQSRVTHIESGTIVLESPDAMVRRECLRLDESMQREAQFTPELSMIQGARKNLAARADSVLLMVESALRTKKLLGACDLT